MCHQRKGSSSPSAHDVTATIFPRLLGSFCGVTPLAFVDFQHADIRSADYRLCMALRVGGVVVALPGAGPVFRSCWPTVQPLPALTQWGCTHLAIPGALEICKNLAEQGDGKHRIISHEKHWFTTIGRDFFFLKLSDFCGINNSLNTAKIMLLLKVISCNNLF